ncbi:MAG: cytochrome c biogenesis protein ResB [Planctomycetes bacterium]|nr:cytochrome c biogenesis protein ResB [Planctomycetota bacterium]
MARQSLYRLLTSLPFAVTLLGTVLFLTALGTVILQGGPAADYPSRYGKGLGGAILALGLDDLFHTAWFNGLLVLLSISLALVVVRRRAWRLPQCGFLLSHGGVILVLLGALVANVWGFKGFIDLHEGETVTEAVSMDRRTQEMERRALNFSLRLDDFEIERHQPEYRFYVYRMEGEKYRVLRSLGLRDSNGWAFLADSGAEFRVLRAFPDYYQEARVKVVPAGEGGPGLRIRSANDVLVEGRLLWAGKPGRDQARLGDWEQAVRFVWDRPTPDEEARMAEEGPEGHVLVVAGDGCCPAEEVAVKPGGRYPILMGRFHVEVGSYMPDFVYDMETRQAATRSSAPNNPALFVSIRAEGESGVETHRWLFAQMPDYGGHGKAESGPALTYRHLPSTRPLQRELLVVGQSREVWELENGRVKDRTVLECEGRFPKMPDYTFQFLESAREEIEPATRSNEWKNPAVEIELRYGSHAESLLLQAMHGEPILLPDGRTLLSFEPKPDDIKGYLSRLSVMDQGREMVQKTIRVNDPLSYGGFLFYQANYRKEDSTYSGIQVVRDPGLPLVWTGMVMMCLGVVFSFYVRPKILQRESIPAAES